MINLKLRIRKVSMIVLMLTCGLFCQIKAFAQFELMDKIGKAVQVAVKDPANPNYLKPIYVLKAKEKLIAKADEDTRSFFYQYLGFYQSFVANYDSAHYYFDKALTTSLRQRNSASVKPLDVKRVKVYNAKDYLLKRAKSERVLMINEAHHVGQHRAFAATLLPGLYQQGYRFLMVETLNYKDTLLNQRGYPLAGSGYYSQEPQMANLIRQAIGLGYQVLPYEARKRGARSKQQAENLYQVLKQNPGAKMLVYAGIQNVEENHQAKRWVKMGEEFTKLTGINPFTIDQTEMMERSQPAYEHPYYRYVLRQGWLKDYPIVLEDQDRAWIADTGNLFVNYVDVQVFLPRVQSKNGRPNWLNWGTTKKYYKVDLQKWKINQTCIIQAFLPNDAKNAVPLDQIHVSPPRFNPICHLVLPKGNYKLKVWDVEKRLLKEEMIVVE